MSNFSRITPFRQLARAYSALLQVADSMDRMSGRIDQISEESERRHRADADLHRSLIAIHGSIEDIANTARRALPPALGENDVTIHELDGYRLLLDRSSMVDRVVMETGAWEGERVEFLARLAASFNRNRAPLFLDIGSYWGYYSLRMHSTGIFHRIYAFDADAYNFSQLQANIFLNRLDHVIVGRHAAVSDHAGTVRIQNSRTHEDGNRGATRVLSSEESAADETTRFVNAIAIDDVLTVKGTPIAIKLDVEAHEPNALRGMRNLIANNEIILQIEIYKEQTESVVPILRDMGLRQLGEMYPDFFYTNIPAAELGQ